MIVALFFVGGYIEVSKPAGADAKITSGGIAACAFIYIYVIGFVMSYGGVPWILSSECVPLSVRSISATLGAATQWLFNLVISKSTSYMINSIGGGTFFFFGSFALAGMVYVWFFVPETREIPLEHMAEVFTRGSRSLGRPGMKRLAGHDVITTEEKQGADVEEVETSASKAV